MNKNVQWKLLAIIGRRRVCRHWRSIPQSDRIRLGLDLEGGVHMVLRVQTDDALQVENRDIGRAADRATQICKAMAVMSVLAAIDPTTIRVEGVPENRDAEFRQISRGPAGRRHTGRDDRVSASVGQLISTGCGQPGRDVAPRRSRCVKRCRR